MESWITLFTAHGKAKVQLSHVLQTELPTIPKDSQLYTFPQCRLLRKPSHSSYQIARFLKFGTKIAFFIKTCIFKLVIIDKSARRVYNERPKRSC